jgi:hypothetical protein
LEASEDDGEWMDYFALLIGLFNLDLNERAGEINDKNACKPWADMISVMIFDQAASEEKPEGWTILTCLMGS